MHTRIAALKAQVRSRRQYRFAVFGQAGEPCQVVAPRSSVLTPAQGEFTAVPPVKRVLVDIAERRRIICEGLRGLETVSSAALNVINVREPVYHRS